MIKTLSKKAGFVLAVAGAAVIGGATTALVAAAIPDSGGTIHGCYSKVTGALKVVDSEAGKSCNGLENNLTWSAGGGTSANKVAYAAFNADGTLNTSYSSNISNAQLVLDPGQDPNNPNPSYSACFNVSFIPKWGMGYTQSNNGAEQHIGTVAGDPDPDERSQITDACGSGYNAVAEIFARSMAGGDRFYFSN